MHLLGYHAAVVPPSLRPPLAAGALHALLPPSCRTCASRKRVGTPFSHYIQYAHFLLSPYHVCVLLSSHFSSALFFRPARLCRFVAILLCQFTAWTPVGRLGPPSAGYPSASSAPYGQASWSGFGAATRGPGTAPPPQQQQQYQPPQPQHNQQPGQHQHHQAGPIPGYQHGGQVRCVSCLFVQTWYPAMPQTGEETTSIPLFFG